VGLVVVTVAVLGAVVSHRADRSKAAAELHPNIVLILTDDQRWDTLWAMPNVRRLLARHGTTFSNAFVVNSLCCPSRTSILTGNYSHTTGIYTNSYPDGGFEAFTVAEEDHSTIATWLHDAGYRTALIGKYLNQYRQFTDGKYIPPGWDRWDAFYENIGRYYDYLMSDNGHVTWHGDAPSDYSTNVLANKAVNFVRATTSPFFLYFAPYAPHRPARPAPGDGSAFSDLEPWRPPSYNEADVSDKPRWAQARPLLSPTIQAANDRLGRNVYRSLLAVDRAVGRIVRTLEDTGRLGDTMIVFMSDNGFLDGEHRLIEKVAPYEESIRVPLVVRYDPLTTERRVDSSHLVLNIDLAPTFAQLAGVTPPDMEGSSFLPFLSDPVALGRRDFLVEHLGATRLPTYCSVRSTRYDYTVYQYSDTQEKEDELYDLQADPYELDNLASDPAYASIKASLHDRLSDLCVPAPPRSTLP
jgi:N-acetylglucosamine-6-sulfatase